MKDFAKSIVCNTKAEAEKIGNFENPEKAKYYIQSWERSRDQAKRALHNAETHLKEAMKHRYGDKNFQQREVERYQEDIKAAEADVRRYDDMIKAAQKSTWGNSRVGNSFESAKSEYEKAVREIESELKSAKPNINKYFQINERVGRILSSERNNIQKELSAKISELINMESNIGRLEDKFYK